MGFSVIFLSNYPNIRRIIPTLLTNERKKDILKTKGGRTRKMLQRLALKLTSFIFKNAKLDSELFEVYKYGVEITISSLLNIVLIITAGIVISDVISGVIFLAVFILLRSFVGGYHAKTYFMCNALFLLTYLVVYYINSALTAFINKELLSRILTVFILLGIIPIIAFAPVKNPYKPLSERHARISRMIGIAVYILLSIAGLALYYGNIRYGSFTILTLASVLIVIEIIKKRRCSS